VGLPAFVEGRYFDVPAANNLAYALLSPNLEVGRNRLRDVFLDPAEQALYADRGNALVRLVAGFRRSIGNDVDDPRVIQLVGELSLSSERFRRIWARHDECRQVGAPRLPCQADTCRWQAPRSFGTRQCRNLKVDQLPTCRRADVPKAVSQ
jgi:hypothetical protein